MAIINSPIGKSLQGKLGKQFTVYQCLGKTVLRLLPESYQPSGNGPKAQQCRIRSLNILYKAVKASGFSDCWKKAERPPGWSGFNYFIAKNLPAFSPEGLIGDPDKVYITTGTGIFLPDEMMLCREGEYTWTLTWKNTTLYPGSRKEDRVIAVLMRGKNHFDLKVLHPEGVACRKEKHARIEIPVEWQEYTHLYCFMYSGPDKVSESKHLLLT